MKRLVVFVDEGQSPEVAEGVEPVGSQAQVSGRDLR